METQQYETRYRGQKASASLTAANTWTDPVPILGPFNLSLSGTWVGTITIQRSFDNGVTWLDVTIFTANIEYLRDEPELGALYRAGFKAGEYTSGTAAVRISQ
jgi:hypothetical protein